MTTELREGFIGLPEGQNDSVDPAFLSTNQYYKGVNVSSRGGKMRTRPPFKPLSSIGVASGTFQGAYLYRWNNVERLITVADGTVTIADLNGTDYNIYAGLSATAPVVWIQQVDKYLIVQDNVSWPFIFDGYTKVDQAALPDYQRVPRGTVMAYGHGRLFVVVDHIYDSTTHALISDLGQRFFRAGDIIKANAVSDVLEFTEDEYWSEGGAFSLPHEMGFINGMTFFRNSATGTGLGALVVIARDGSAAYGVDTARSTWKDSDMSKVLFLGHGTESPRSVITVNDDIVYRSDDGYRTIRYTLSETASGSGSLSNKSISGNVNGWLGLDSRSSLPYVSMANVNNRLYCLCNRTGGAFKGMVSLDNNVLSSIASGAPPAYDGVWTGLSFQQILTGNYLDKETLLAICSDGAGNNTLWYLDETANAHYDNVSSKTKSRIYLRAHNFGDMVVGKQLQWVEFVVSTILMDTQIKCYYKPDGYPLWSEFDSIDILCAEGTYPQRRFKIKAGISNRKYDPITNQSTDKGTWFEFCIEYTGHLKIEQCHFTATQEIIDAEIISDTESKAFSAIESAGVELNDFDYAIGE